MPNIIELTQWEDGVYQLETNDPVIGGADGIDNLQAKQLANRTQYLKAQQEAHAAAADPHPQYMTTAESEAAIAAAVALLVNSSPAALDTLAELATALGNDANFAATITAALADKQANDATLTALAAIVTAADKLIYATGADTFSTTTLSAFMRTLLDDADAATALITLGADARYAIRGDIAGKNKLINGNFSINQHAVSGAVTLAAGAYGHDRFKAGAGGCTYTFAASNNVTTLTITAGTLQQAIDGRNLLSGTHTLSWVGTAQGRIDAGAYGASGITGNAVGGTNQVCEWGTGTLSKVQYEPGAAATVFEQRDYTIELLMCRYYWKSISWYLASVAQYDASNIYAVVKGAGEPMRSAPTVSLANAPTIAAPGNTGTPIAGFGGHGADLQGTHIRIWATKANHGLTNSTAVFMSSGSSVILNAEI